MGIGVVAFLMVGPHHLPMHAFMDHTGPMDPDKPMRWVGAGGPGEFLAHLLPLLFFGFLIAGRFGSGPRDGRQTRRARRFARRASHDARRGITWL